MGPSAPVIPADPVTSSLNLPEDRPEAAESDRLQLHFTEAAAAMMVCVVGDEGGGGGVVSGRRPTTNWLGVVLGEDDGGRGGGGSVPSQTSPEHSTNHSYGLTDGRTDSRPVRKQSSCWSPTHCQAGQPRISSSRRPSHQEETHKKKKSNTLLLWLQTQTGQGRLPLGLRPRLSTDDQSDSETHSRGRHSDVAPGRRRGNWDTAEKPAGPDTSGATRPRHNQRKPFGSDTSSWRSI